MNNMTKKQKYDMEQVAATMAIENMPLTKQAFQNLIDAAEGKKTEEQIIEEIKKRYQNA